MKENASSEAHSSELVGIEFIRGNLLRLPFDDDSVDLILDKGSTDAVLRRGRGGERGGVTDAAADFATCWAEMKRVLRRDRIGKILHVSDEDPDVRMLLLEQSLGRASKKRRNVRGDDDDDGDDEDFGITFELVDTGNREVFFYSIS